MNENKVILGFKNLLTITELAKLYSSSRNTVTKVIKKHLTPQEIDNIKKKRAMLNLEARNSKYLEQRKYE
jgi:Fic family protein